MPVYLGTPAAAGEISGTAYQRFSAENTERTLVVGGRLCRNDA